MLSMIYGVPVSNLIVMPNESAAKNSPWIITKKKKKKKAYKCIIYETNNINKVFRKHPS